MFVVRPYENHSTIAIYFDGTDFGNASPAAVEIAGGYTYLEASFLSGRSGKKIELTPKEATALALTSIGMGELAVEDRIEEWFDLAGGSTNAMYAKLGVSGQQAGEVAVALAFDNGVFLPERPPRLAPLRDTLRQRFLAITALLAAGRFLPEMDRVLNLATSTIYTSIENMANDLGLADLQRRGAALVMLAGAAELLPRPKDDPDQINSLVSMSQKKPAPLSPSQPTQTLIMSPIDDDPTAQLWFAGQPLSQLEPNLHVGYLSQIRIMGAVVDVYDILFQNYEGKQTRLTPREAAMLALRALGIQSKETVQRTALRGRGQPEGLIRMYTKLLPPHPSSRRNRAAERAIAEAFRMGIFVARKRPDLSRLSRIWRSRLQQLIPRVAQGMTDAEIGAELHVGHGVGSFILKHLRDTLGVRTETLVLLAEADKLAAPASELKIVSSNLSSP